MYIAADPDGEESWEKLHTANSHGTVTTLSTSQYPLMLRACPVALFGVLGGPRMQKGCGAKVAAKQGAHPDADPDSEGGVQ